jgi:hypothetical protein
MKQLDKRRLWEHIGQSLVGHPAEFSASTKSLRLQLFFVPTFFHIDKPVSFAEARFRDTLTTLKASEQRSTAFRDFAEGSDKEYMSTLQALMFDVPDHKRQVHTPLYV